jgi:hypothetical protein
MRLAKIKQNGAELTDIQKYQAEEKRSTEVQLRENGYWAGVLIRSSQNGENPDHTAPILPIWIRSPYKPPKMLPTNT